MAAAISLDLLKYIKERARPYHCSGNQSRLASIYSPLVNTFVEHHDIMRFVTPDFEGNTTPPLGPRLLGYGHRRQAGCLHGP